jgi:hypothetical protein
MPTYEFLNKDTGKLEEYVLSISSYDEFKKNNPHLERYIQEAAAFSYSGTGDIRKEDGGFKEVMAKIAEQNPKSPLADKYGKKSIKEIKTQQTLQHHRKIQKEKRAAKAAK